MIRILLNGLDQLHRFYPIKDF